MGFGGEVALRELARAGRRLRRRWPITALAVITLGLAMGANTAMFSVFYGMVAHPLPFPHPNRLVWLQTTNLRSGAINSTGFSTPDVDSYRNLTRELRHMAAYETLSETVLGHGRPMHISYTGVSGDFFAALGIKPLLGRTLNRQDEVPRERDHAVLSYGFWKAEFGGDPHALGRTLDLDDKPITIIGVMPQGFDYPPGVEIWENQPMESNPYQNRSWRYLSVFARLAPGATLAGAQAEMSALARRMARQYPGDDANVGVKVSSMAAQVAGPMAPTLDLMMIGALLVLVLACANVGNLMLGTAVARWRELALEISLGANRKRLVGQLLAEGGILALLSGAVGWLIALAVVPGARALRSASLPYLAQVKLNPAVLGFAAVVTVLAALWFALAPAWELLRPQAARNLFRAASPVPPRSRLPSVLVVAEVGVTVVLLAGASLFWQSLRRLEAVPSGFSTDHVLTLRASLLYYTQAELDRKEVFFMRLNQSLKQLPGVLASGMTSQMPYQPPTAWVGVAAAGSAQAAAPGARPPRAEFLASLPGYFAAMGMRLQGHDFGPGDNGAKAQPVVIINQSLAHTLFPGQDALGKSLVYTWGSPATARIIGISADVALHRPGGELAPDLFVPLGQSYRDNMTIVLHVRGDPYAMLPAVRRAMAQLDPQVPVYRIATNGERLAAVTAPVRYRAHLLAGMALLALCLAVAGIYGVLAQAVAQRRREIGIRMALGASALQMGGAVLWQSLRLIAGGVAAGLLISWWLHGSLRHLLFAAAAASNAWTWVGVPVLVLVVGLLASGVPARRAARVDPVALLRVE
ncbi:MAG: ADOP family duplicated permease [Terriglobales bacterium]